MDGAPTHGDAQARGENIMRGTGAVNTNFGAGQQSNNTQNGGSSNNQYNFNVYNGERSGGSTHPAALTNNTSTFGTANAGIQVAQSSGPIYVQQARPESPPLPASTSLPRPDPDLVDRDELLDQISVCAAQKYARIGLIGLGGIGKTQLALRYAEKLRERDGDIWILWIFAANTTRFTESLQDLAEQIKLPGRREAQADLLGLLQAWLANASRRWLLVLDNVDDAEVLLECPGSTTKRRIDYIPSCRHGSVLITSRRKVEAQKIVNNIIDVTPMDLKHAESLLRAKLGADKHITRLAIALDCIPLALSQAASFIKLKRGYTIDGYIAELESSRESRMGLLHKHGPESRDRDAKPSVMLSWQISFEHINRIRKSAADLLALMSFCDRQSIPRLLLCYGATEKTFEEDMQMLEDFANVSSRTNTTWDMHRLVQDAMQWWLSDQKKLEGAGRSFIRRIYEVMPVGKYENWRLCEVLLPHCQGAVVRISDEREVALQQGAVLHRMAWLAVEKGLPAEAIVRSQMSLSIRMKWCGDDDEESLASLDLLACAKRDAGQYTEAETLGLKAVDGSRRVHGEVHPSTLISMGHLAHTYNGQGRYAEAAELQVKVLETFSRVLGEKHPSTLVSMNNLASMYNALGRYAEAEELQTKVLDMLSGVFGEEHPGTLKIMGNLAVTYSRQGRYDECQELIAKALNLHRRVLGEKHPETLDSMSILATTLEAQDTPEAARDLMKHCFQLRVDVLGERHPYTVESANDLQRMEHRLHSVGQNKIKVSPSDIKERKGLKPSRTSKVSSLWTAALFCGLRSQRRRSIDASTIK